MLHAQEATRDISYSVIAWYDVSNDNGYNVGFQLSNTSITGVYYIVYTDKHGILQLNGTISIRPIQVHIKSCTKPPGKLKYLYFIKTSMPQEVTMVTMYTFQSSVLRFDVLSVI